MTDRTHPDSGRTTGGIVEMLQDRVAELEAQLKSISAGGVSGPLMGRTDSNEREAFEAWRSDLPYQGATQLQKEAFIAGFRAAIEQGGSGAAIAEIGSAAGEDAEFGQRAIYPLVDIDRFEYGTKLYARASLAANAGSEPVALNHIACIEDGELRYMAGRKAPSYDCELYAMPGGKSAPPLYTHPSPPEGMVGGWTKAEPLIARSLGEWNEDDGPVVWWAWNGHGWAGESPWIGTPLDSDWPDYHTHWTPAPPTPTSADGVEHG